jgi:Putative peptidoglycan binding domain
MSAIHCPGRASPISAHPRLEAHAHCVQFLNVRRAIRVFPFESFKTMKLTRLFPAVPILSALALLAVPATGLCDKKKITVYQDNDGDGHYHKKKIEVPHRSYHYQPAPSYYHRPYPYVYRPSVSVSVQRSYSSGYSSRSYSDELAVDVQRELRRRGYYRGSIDGDVGPGTRNAIANYQDDRGLPVTGRIDRNLLRSLGID